MFQLKKNLTHAHKKVTISIVQIWTLHSIFLRKSSRVSTPSSKLDLFGGINIYKKKKKKGISNLVCHSSEKRVKLRRSFAILKHFSFGSLIVSTKPFERSSEKKATEKQNKHSYTTAIRKQFVFLECRVSNSNIF